MLLTPNFVKALKGIFIALIVLYLIRIGLQFYGIEGISLSSSNSLLRVILNEVVRFSSILIFWLAVMMITNDRVASIAAIVINTISMLYIRSLFSYTSELSQVEIQELMDSVNAVRIMADISAYSVFGLLHFKRLKGLFLIFVWLTTYGITSGPSFSSEQVYLNKFLKILDLDNLFYIKMKTEEGGIKYVDLLRPFYGQFYLLFDFIIFWFVYALIKAGKSFDLSLRTIKLHPVINQLTFSLIYWPLRVILFITSFGMVSLVAVSFQREWTWTGMMQIAAACFSIFVIASLYRNFLTDYLVSRSRSPAWLFLFLNIPILSFLAWIYTFFIPARYTSTLAYAAATVDQKVQPSPEEDLASQPDEPDDPEEQSSEEETAPFYEGPPVYQVHPLQDDFTAEGRNAMIKILLILFSIGLMAVQLKNTSIGFVRPDSDQTEAPILLLLITLAFTIWYMFDWKALFPLFFLQCFGIISIAFFQMQGSLTPMIGAGLVNMMIYYSLFHFDRLNLIGSTISEAETTRGNIT